LAEGGRRFCENCGAEVRQTANFCPNCGTAQHPEPEAPTGPLSPVYEPDRTRASSDPGGPPLQEQSHDSNLMRNIIIVLVLLIVLLILISRCGSGGGSKGGGGGSTTASEGTTQEQAKGQEKKKQEKATEDSNASFGDGTHRVGEDIQPGTYRTREGSSGCYYARLSGFGGGAEEILSNEVTDAPSIVTIEPTDAGFQSRRCGTWTQDLSPITTSTTSFEDGTYFVGTDIEPGTYRSSGSSGCYYARLAGFSGGFENLIANEVTDTPSIVTIESTDAGFQSKKCGTWTRVE
jgi:preprotein translocase subunit SecG